MSIYFNREDSFLDSSYFKQLPNEDKLTTYDNLVVQLSEALESAENNPYSRMSADTKYSYTQDLKRIRERRKLLVESMGVLNRSQNNISNNQNFVNSQVHYGTGDNVSGSKISNNITEIKERPSIPVWAQWIGWIIAILAFVWAIYIYFIPH